MAEIAISRIAAHAIWARRWQTRSPVTLKYVIRELKDAFPRYEGRRAVECANMRAQLTLLAEVVIYLSLLIITALPFARLTDHS